MGQSVAELSLIGVGSPGDALPVGEAAAAFPFILPGQFGNEDLAGLLCIQAGA